MADNAHHAHNDSSAGGTMDIREHVKTWLGFWAGIKYSSIALAGIAILLFIFRTHNG